MNGLRGERMLEVACPALECRKWAKACGGESHSLGS